MSEQPHRNEGPYDPDYQEMARDIASQRVWLPIKRVAIPVLLGIAAVAFFFIAPLLGLAPLIGLIGAGVMALGAVAMSFSYAQQARELEMLEEYAHNYAEGHSPRGQWHNLRREIYDSGYNLGYLPSPLPFGQGAPPRGRPQHAH